VLVVGQRTLTNGWGGKEWGIVNTPVGEKVKRDSDRGSGAGRGEAKNFGPCGAQHKKESKHGNISIGGGGGFGSRASRNGT